MKTKVPFTFDYTKEMSEAFNKEFKQSGECSVQNPDFFGNWDLVKYGTPEYTQVFDKKRKDK